VKNIMWQKLPAPAERKWLFKYDENMTRTPAKPHNTLINQVDKIIAVYGISFANMDLYL